ncbi:RNA helicase [Malassezia vespertilionis]|uniref:P-loop containing nucleoside triphosphate hydrolase protein n=1 Tax=Malassezia vespertilionis TaxID=2020962 RepID=A0A2N1JEY5_9BASI|nr:RNA helicase [Malassezia vespertilionis]PKI85085.1 hypothetical protein MVES_001227 [Malassezia vespertilionis]WFD05969.1 RNA helicase [Malassezia vespertilionis]
MAPRKKNAAIKASGVTSSKAAPLPDWVKGGGPKPVSATTTRADGTQELFPPGSKTPLNLLYERVQKMPGFARPDVHARRTKDGYTCVITIIKENKQDKSNPFTLRMEPLEPGARLHCETALEAKHWGATYVLFRLFSQLNLYRNLPPGPREYWLALEQVKKEARADEAWKWAADPFEAIQKRDAEREAMQKQRAARDAAKGDPKRGLSKAWQNAKEVRMAPALRELVESTIRAQMTDDCADVVPLADGAAHSQIDTQKLVAELTKLGVRGGYMRRVLSWLQDARMTYADPAKRSALQHNHPVLASILALPDRDAAIEYIVLYTPEQDLPPQLKPTASAESFVTSAVAGSDSLVDRWTLDRLEKQAGFPRKAAAEILGKVRAYTLPQATSVGLVLDMLLHQLIGESMDLDHAVQATSPEAEQRQAEERTMLEDFFGPLVPVDPHARLTDTSVLLHVGEHQGKPVMLVLVPHPLSLYLAEPGALPSIYVVGESLPAFLRLALTQHAMQALRGMHGREDMREILEACEGGALIMVQQQLAEVLEAMVHDPPSLDSVMEHLIAAPSSTLPHAPLATEPHAAAPRRAVHKIPALQHNDALDKRLVASLHALHASLKYSESIAPVRTSLPAHTARATLLQAVASHPVVLITGETGCGKTTQVPQFLLDDAIASGTGSLCNILVTQPRRVSAMGVAARVAVERCESLEQRAEEGALVGYAIRGERRAAKSCRLLFTTTGVLLRRLASGADPELQSISHVIVDEVHERSTESDFLLLLLRDVLTRNKKLRVILMSATVTPETFINYFGRDTPYKHIPGRTFPVQDHYMEEIVAMSAFESERPYTHEHCPADPMLALDAVPPPQLRTLRALATQPTDYTFLARTVALAAQRAEKIDHTGLLTGKASILVFCPGVGEIRRAIDAIVAQRLPGAVLLPLHANLAPSEQRKVFQSVRKDERKIVVSTNVAETSITIPDVCFVVDTGRVREAHHDAKSSLTRLEETWASRAACKQRAGRAGRTMPGESFRLYSRGMEESLQRAQSIPEIQRTPLEGLVLQVKSIQPGADLRAFLQRAIDPPSTDALEATHYKLQVAGALQPGGFNAPLTPLGQHLAQLPLDVRLGKLLVLGCLFGCVEPLLHVVAILASRPMVAAQRDEEAAKARAAYLYGNSDLLAHANIFAAFLTQRREKRDVRKWCATLGLSYTALQDVAMTRTQLLRNLEDLRLVPASYAHGWRTEGPRWPMRPGVHALDAHAANTNLLRSMLLAAMWASVARVDLPSAKFNASAAGAVEKEADARALHYFDEHDGRVFLHPSSMLFHATKFKSNYLAVCHKSANAQRTYLRDATEAPLYALLLFGGPLYVHHDMGGIAIATGAEADADGWVKLRASARVGVLCRQLRTLMNRTLQAGIEEPQAMRTASNQQVVDAMIALVTQDGLE